MSGPKQKRIFAAPQKPCQMCVRQNIRPPAGCGGKTRTVLRNELTGLPDCRGKPVNHQHSEDEAASSTTSHATSLAANTFHAMSLAAHVLANRHGRASVSLAAHALARRPSHTSGPSTTTAATSTGLNSHATMTLAAHALARRHSLFLALARTRQRERARQRSRSRSPSGPSTPTMVATTSHATPLAALALQGRCHHFPCNASDCFQQAFQGR